MDHHQVTAGKSIFVGSACVHVCVCVCVCVYTCVCVEQTHKQLLTSYYESLMRTTKHSNCGADLIEEQAHTHVRMFLYVRTHISRYQLLT